MQVGSSCRAYFFKDFGRAVSVLTFMAKNSIIEIFAVKKSTLKMFKRGGLFCKLDSKIEAEAKNTL